MLSNQVYPQLSYLTATIQDGGDIGVSELESLIQVRYPAVATTEELRLTFNSGKVSVTGLTVPACEALFKVAGLCHLDVTRIGIAVALPACRENFITGETEHTTKKLLEFYRKHLPRVKVFEPVGDVNAYQFGARTSEQMLLTRLIGASKLHVEWRVRNDQAKRVALSLFMDDSGIQGLMRAFQGLTNSLLQPDFFNIGLYLEEFIPKRIGEPQSGAASVDTEESFRLWLDKVVAKRVASYCRAKGEDSASDIIAICAELEDLVIDRLCI